MDKAINRKNEKELKSKPVQEKVQESEFYSFAPPGIP